MSVSLNCWMKRHHNGSGSSEGSSLGPCTCRRVLASEGCNPWLREVECRSATFSGERIACWAVIDCCPGSLIRLALRECAPGNCSVGGASADGWAEAEEAFWLYRGRGVLDRDISSHERWLQDAVFAQWRWSSSRIEPDPVLPDLLPLSLA
jgi:hypothetical protein